MPKAGVFVVVNEVSCTLQIWGNRAGLSWMVVLQLLKKERFSTHRNDGATPLREGPEP